MDRIAAFSQCGPLVAMREVTTESDEKEYSRCST